MEEHLYELVGFLKLGIEATGALFVGIGCISAVFIYLKSLLKKDQYIFQKIRLTLAKFLVLGLEFQLGADILATAISPNWDSIGKLAAIAVIRTILNYFLTQELKDNQEEIKV